MAQLLTELGPDESIKITRTFKHPTPLFMALGRLGTSSQKIEGFDTSMALHKLDGNSARFFWFLVMHRDYESNICKIDRSVALTAKDKGRIPRAYAILSNAKLIVRQFNSIYLINPKAVLPKFEHYEKVWSNWIAACEKQGIPYK